MSSQLVRLEATHMRMCVTATAFREPSHQAHIVNKRVNDLALRSPRLFTGMIVNLNME